MIGKEQKTIFIPIMGRLQARNILRTGIARMLAKNPNVRVVLLAPSLKAEEYAKEFREDGTVFEGIGDLPLPASVLDVFFDRLALFYINSPNARLFRKEWLLFGKKNVLRYGVSRLLLAIFGNTRPLRKLSRSLDYVFVHDRRYASFFDRYKPDIVFVPRIDARLDRIFMQEARRRGIRTVGMISSWDNITIAKNPFRTLPDTLIVHNEVLKDEAVRYLDMPKDSIRVSGIPHFDHYVRTPRSSREEFCRRLNIDPGRKIILFASIGYALNPTESEVLGMLDNAIMKGILLKECTVIFRFHPSEKRSFKTDGYSGAIVFDDSKTFVQKENIQYTEVLAADMHHLADSLYHADVSINTCSTMSIDAAAFDTPVVNIAFDGLSNEILHRSVRLFYEPTYVHYQPIIRSGGVRIAYSFDELIRHINAYLKDPSLDREGRERIVREQCYKLDGKAGERVAHSVLKQLG